MVERCRHGRYSQVEANRGLAARLRCLYFEQEGPDWVARPDLRGLIDASQLNLVGPWDQVPRCDLVMLRNVLIYFNQHNKQEVLRRIRTDVLKPGGILMLGSSESTMYLDDVYARRTFGKTVCYQAPGGASPDW
jgi:chemotaxis protein methyltransferase CheR